MTMAAASGEPFSVKLEADEQGALWSWTRSAPGIKSPSGFRAGGASPCAAREAGAARRARVGSRRVQ
jgi:hypothetical protein